jgi:hypothetical protein
MAHPVVWKYAILREVGRLAPVRVTVERIGVTNDRDGYAMRPEAAIAPFKQAHMRHPWLGAVL